MLNMFRVMKNLIDKKENKIRSILIFIIIILSGLICLSLELKVNEHEFMMDISKQDSVNLENIPAQDHDTPNDSYGLSDFDMRGTRALSFDLDLQQVLGYGSTVGFFNSIKTADVDNDGKEEMVFGNEGGNIFVVEKEGNHLINEWVSPFLGGGKTYGLALGDVDSDSTIEIVVGSADGIIRIFGWNGTAYEIEWESPDLGSFAWGLDIGNVDEDDFLEIVVGTGEIEYVFNSNGEWSVEIFFSPTDENIFVFGFDGNDFEQEWSAIIPAFDRYTCIYNIAIGDTDNDSYDEIVIGTFDIKIDDGQRLGRFGVFGFNGLTYSTEWPLTDLGGWVMSLVLGNTDDEEDLEIVIAVYGPSPAFAVHVYGYNDPIYLQEWLNTDLHSTSLVVGDTDEDGIAEIVASQGRWVKIYEFSNGAYELTWESGDLGIYVSGVGVGQIDFTSQNEVLVADYYSLLVYEKEDSTYELKVFEKGIDRIVSYASWDIDGNGITELYTLSRRGVVSILEFDGMEFIIKDTFQFQHVNSDPNIKYSNIHIADFDGDDSAELVIVEGNTSIDYILGTITRSMQSRSTLFFVEYVGGGYSIVDQVFIANNSIFSIDVGDLDGDTLPEIAVGGAEGDLFIIGYVGSSYQIENVLHISDDIILCVGIGDTDGEGFLEIGLGDESPMAFIIGYDGNNYIEKWNVALSHMDFPLCLEIDSMDDDEYEEVFIKGGPLFPLTQELPLSIYGWNGIDYDEEERLNDYDITFDEGLLIGEIVSDASSQLLISSFKFSVLEYDMGYSEIWSSEVSGTNAVCAEIADIDDYEGNEMIIALDGMMLIYGSRKPPIAVLSVSKYTVSIGEEITFYGSNSTGNAPLKYLFDFGDSITTGWVTDSITTHSYSFGGTYNASLKVRDKNDIESVNPTDVTITVIDLNKAPIAYIDEIAPNPAVKGEKVNFKGHGEDEDGSIVSYFWESDVDGTLSTMASFSKSSLSVGTHTILFKVRDNNDKWSEIVSSALVIKPKTGNQVPTAYIDSISPNPALEGEAVTFTGHGIDDDGTIISYWWESNINGFLSDKSSFSSSSLLVGDHTLSFKVKDDDEAWSQTDTTYLTIEPKPENLIPIAYIDSVSPNPAVEGETVTFVGHGIDSDGSINSYSWESDIDGFLSSERSFSISSLSIGVHTITFKVKDNNDVWSDPVTITLVVEEEEKEPTNGIGVAGDELVIILFIVILLIIIIVIAVIIVFSKRGDSKRGETSAVVAMQVSCPGCGSVFDAVSSIRPLAVQCPNCGLSGVLNE